VCDAGFAKHWERAPLARQGVALEARASGATGCCVVSAGSVRRQRAKHWERAPLARQGVALGARASGAQVGIV